MTIDEKIIKLRDGFREIADIIDELIELGSRADNGEDVEKEMESTFGRYMFKLLSLEELK